MVLGGRGEGERFWIGDWIGDWIRVWMGDRIGDRIGDWIGDWIFHFLSKVFKGSWCWEKRGRGKG